MPEEIWELNWWVCGGFGSRGASLACNFSDSFAVFVNRYSVRVGVVYACLGVEGTYGRKLTTSIVLAFWWVFAPAED